MIADVVRDRGRTDQGHARHRLEQHRRGPAADRWAPRAGADAALVVAPYYNKPTQEGFYQHFKALAEAVDLPICVYNIPGRTGKNIEPETIARLAELKKSRWSKKPPARWTRLRRSSALTDLTVLSGDDSLTLPLLAIGGRAWFRSWATSCPATDRADRRLRRRRPGRRPPLAPQALPAVPRHAGPGDQPDSGQGGHADAGPRHGRIAIAHDSAYEQRRTAFASSTLAGYGLL